jgi:hypothetical protein
MARVRRQLRSTRSGTLLYERALECVDGCGIWRVGHGDVFGAVLDMFGLGGGAGRVCAVCVSQVDL